MKFVGAPTRYVTNDLVEQQIWLDQYHESVKAAIGEGPSLGVLPKRHFRSEIERLPDGVYWNFEYAVEAAIEGLLTRDQVMNYHFEEDPLANFLPELPPLIEETRKWMATLYHKIWAEAIPEIPDHIQGSAYPSLDGMIRIGVHAQLSAVKARATCPNCHENTDECHETITGRGFLQCQGCAGILVDSQNHDLPFEDGIHLIEAGVVPLTAILDVLAQAKGDDSRFNVGGPADEWVAGSLRVQALILDGAIGGFSTWNESGGHRVLRTVWVQAAARNSGWGAKLVDIEAACLEIFRVEAPNDACLEIFKRLGYFETKKILEAPTS
jgi:hypothetical protein